MCLEHGTGQLPGSTQAVPSGCSGVKGTIRRTTFLTFRTISGNMILPPAIGPGSQVRTPMEVAIRVSITCEDYRPRTTHLGRESAQCPGAICPDFRSTEAPRHP